MERQHKTIKINPPSYIILRRFGGEEKKSQAYLPTMREEPSSTAEQAMSGDIFLDQPHINNSPAHFLHYHTTQLSGLCQASDT